MTRQEQRFEELVGYCEARFAAGDRRRTGYPPSTLPDVGDAEECMESSIVTALREKP